MIKKRTIVRIISESLGALEWVSPLLAARWGTRLFFTPGRPNIGAREARVLAAARRFHLRVGTTKVVGYRWGTGKPVLLVHGWGGHSAQFAELVETLREHGQAVVSLDFPAHGGSPGRCTNVFEFRAALLRLARKEGPFSAIVGHSLGAMAATLALRSGLSAERVVLVAPMTSFTFAVDEFSRQLDLSPQLKARTTAEIVERFGDGAELELVRHVGEMPVPLLVVHDQDDHRVPPQLGRDLAAAWPRASYLETRGLGHSRILSAPEVMRQVVEFVTLPAPPSRQAPRRSGIDGLLGPALAVAGFESG